MRLLAIFVFALLFGVANAQLFPTFCSDLFQGAGNFGPGGYQTGGVLYIAFLIVVVVLASLGIVYAFGRAVGMDSLISFTRTELAESIFNIVIIVFVLGGLAFAGKAISFITNLGAIGSAQFGVNVQSVSGTQDLYTRLCNSYINNGVESVIPAIVSTAFAQAFLKSLQSQGISAAPTGFGFAYKPYAGLAPLVKVLDAQIDFFFLIAGLFVALPIFLYLIYFLFPYLLYVGVLLRSFPWTRAAGGSLLALFVAFYIIFPAILYPFSTYTPVDFAGFAWLGLNQAGRLVAFSISAILGAFPLTNFVGAAAIGEINNFADVAANLGLQTLGLVMALVVALDLVETLGDLLGAPSMHTQKLLSQVI